MSDVPFLELRLEVGDIDVDILAGDKPSLVEGIFVRMAERDEFVILLEIREREARNPADQANGKVAGAGNAFRDRCEFSIASARDGNRPP